MKQNLDQNFNNLGNRLVARGKPDSLVYGATNKREVVSKTHQVVKRITKNS